MPDNSNRTSNLGPRVSHTTTKAYNGPGHYLLPSWMTTEFDSANNFMDGTMTVRSGGGLTAASGGAVTVASGATLNIQGVAGINFSGATSASLTSLTLPDGYLSIGSVSVASATIYFRSGNTIYEFDAQASGVL